MTAANNGTKGTTKITGKLYGVGTGPGDPELLTLKAVRVLSSCDVVAHFCKRGNLSNARRTVEGVVLDGAIEVPMAYPVTTELDKNSDQYIEKITAFFDASAQTLREHLLAGRSVGVLSEGDPLFYGSYMHLHVRLAFEFVTEVVPGITAMSGCWSAAGLPIIQGDDSLMVLAGTLGENDLVQRLAQNDAGVIMKVGRNLPKIRRALKAAGKYERAVYVERGTMAEGLHLLLADKSEDTAPYFSLILIPGWRTNAASKNSSTKQPQEQKHRQDQDQPNGQWQAQGGSMGGQHPGKFTSAAAVVADNDDGGHKT